MGWCIVGAVAIIFVLVLIFPVHVIIKWNENISVFIRILFFNINTAGLRKKNKKESIEKKRKKRDKPKKEKKSPETVIDEIANTVSNFGPGIEYILKNIRFNLVELYWKICSEDACDCALKYGKICASLGVITSFIQNIVNIKKQKYRVFPDFTGENDSFSLKLDFSFVPAVIIIGLIKLLSAYINTRNDLNKTIKRIEV